MTLKVDGTNGILQAYDYQVLTTGFSYTFAAGTTTLIANPAGTLASGTITMPSAPADGMVITVMSTQQVTAVTVAANTGQTLVGGASQLIPNQPLSFVYRLANTTWYPMAGGAGRASALASGTAVASTSGTSIDFTSIPSWVKRITLLCNGVSKSGTANFLFQLGDSGGIETTGYVSSAIAAVGGNTVIGVTSTSGFVTGGDAATNANMIGQVVFTLIGSNTWICNGLVYMQNIGYNTTLCGNKTLSDTLTQVRITTTSTDTFDAGSINILYE